MKIRKIPLVIRVNPGKVYIGLVNQLPDTILKMLLVIRPHLGKAYISLVTQLPDKILKMPVVSRKGVQRSGGSFTCEDLEDTTGDQDTPSQCVHWSGDPLT